jgi:TolA-binding protein
MRRHRIALLLLLGLSVTVPHVLTAQTDVAKPASASGEKSPADYRGPLPFYFGKLGLSETQKTTFYNIDRSYEERISALRKQIEALEKQRDAELETHLTPGQKLRLQELREEAEQRSQTEKGSESPPPQSGDPRGSSR